MSKYKLSQYTSRTRQHNSHPAHNIYFDSPRIHKHTHIHTFQYIIKLHWHIRETKWQKKNSNRK